MPLLHTLLHLPARIAYLALSITALGLLGFGLYLQHGVGLEPCPMCIMQRYAFLVVALLALLGGVHGPKRRGSRIYAALIGVAALTGASIARIRAALSATAGASGRLCSGGAPPSSPATAIEPTPSTYAFNSGQRRGLA